MYKYIDGEITGDITLPMWAHYPIYIDSTNHIVEGVIYPQTVKATVLLWYPDTILNKM